MNSISLEGQWRLELDRKDAGLGERWFARVLAGRVELPGSLAVQRIGDPPGEGTQWTGTIFDPSWFSAPEYAPFRPPAAVKMPCWLTPDTVYTGVAWYQREIEIPEDWIGRRVTLVLERPHIRSSVWLDDRALGAQDSLGTPHAFELGVFAAPGMHRLTLRIDNRMVVNVGENAHSISDHTQGNWNGVVGRIELVGTAPAWIEDLQVYPHVANRSITVRGRVATVSTEAHPANVALSVEPGGASANAIAGADGNFTAQLDLGADAPLWDEFSPVMHTLTAELPGGEVRRVRFGLREVRAKGRQLLLNGRPLFLRGTLDCALFPRTGHPPMEPEPWRTIFRTLRDYGLNHVRFHSWCPPEAAFVAADELGFYLQVECGLWANTMLPPSITRAAAIGDGDTVDAWVYSEAERVLRACGNHPSFALFAHGNEPGGTRFAAFLADWVKRVREMAAGRCLVTAAAGWPEIAESEFIIVPEPRLHQWGDGLKSRLNAEPPATIADFRESVARRSVPLVSHEIGQWSAFPPLDDEAKYTGHLRPGNHEIFRTWLGERGLADRLGGFVHASGRLQLLCYKEEIEAQLRTPGLGGFQLLGLQDFSGQGTAPVGVLDYFWEPKSCSTAEEFQRFCGPTVILARLPQRVFTAGERFTAELEIAHFGAAPLTGTVAWWALEAANGEILARGETNRLDIRVGNGIALGRVDIPLPGETIAQKLRFVAGLAGTDVENDWDIWVYPVKMPVSLPRGVHMVRAFDAAAEAVLHEGGTVFVSGGIGCARGDARGRVALGFTPIFWNTACTQRQAPHTLGILCDPAHPAFAGFPTDAHTDWQWWYLLMRADALIVDGLPVTLRPLVGVIDDWYSNRRLALVIEARIGRGRLLACGVDLETALESNPVARQLRASLLRYMESKDFAPETELSAAQVAALFRAPPGAM